MTAFVACERGNRSLTLFTDDELAGDVRDQDG